MAVVFQRNLSIGVGGYGNAALTSLDIAQTTMHSLTSRREQRGAIEARIHTSDGPLTVFCTHLGLSSEERLIQAQELAALLNACETPKLICGDFNEEASGEAVKHLIEAAGLVDAGAGVADLGAVAGDPRSAQASLRAPPAAPASAGRPRDRECRARFPRPHRGPAAGSRCRSLPAS